MATARSQHEESSHANDERMKKELDKYLKNLIMKTLRVIVQSRLGCKIRTQTKMIVTPSDWFHVNLEDTQDHCSAAIDPEIKQMIDSCVLSAVGMSTCMEFRLHTAEGEVMVLETWCIKMLGQHDTSVRSISDLYNRMGLLLKSIISVTRITPAYRLSRRQSADSYILMYRSYIGEPEINNLGEKYQQFKLGEVATALGTVCMQVFYRTQLSITPQKVEQECPIMVKSDHFKPDLSPKRPQRQYLFNTHLKQSVTEELAMIFDNYKDNGFHPREVATSPPKEWNGHNMRQYSPCFEKKSAHRERVSDFKLSSSLPNEKMSLKRLAGFSGLGKDEVEAIPIMTDLPFSCLLQHDEDNNFIQGKKLQDKHMPSNSNNNSSPSVTNGVHHQKKVESLNGVCESPCNIFSGCHTEDYVVVEMKKPPFAAPNELGDFYRECQSAPPLLSFNNSEQVSDLGNQLERFEENLKDFDELVDSLCVSD